MNKLELYKELSSKLYGYFLINLKDENAAKDLLQDVYLKITEKKELFKSNINYQGWVFMIAKNLLIDYYRKNKKVTGLNSLTEKITNIDELPEAYKDLLPALEVFIDDLPEKYRNPLILSDIKGMNQSQIAEKLNLSLSGAKSRIQRARQMLKESFFNCSTFEFDKKGRVSAFHPNGEKCVCNRM